MKLIKGNRKSDVDVKFDIIQEEYLFNEISVELIKWFKAEKEDRVKKSNLIKVAGRCEQRYRDYYGEISTQLHNPLVWRHNYFSRYYFSWYRR